MSDKASKAGVENARCYVAQLAQQEVWSLGREWSRPSVLFRPRVYMDGAKWCALYGENIQDGVAGFGYTPDEAMRDFDREWNGRTR